MSDSNGDGGGDGGGSGGALSGGSWSNSSPTRTWGDASGSVTTGPNGSISWSGGGGNSPGQFTEPSYSAPALPQPAWAGSQYTDMQLKDMFAKEPGWRTPQEMGGIAPANNLANGLTQANWGYRNDGVANRDDPNKGLVNWFSPGDLGYKLGLRNFGSEAAKDPMNHESVTERNTRMGLVGDAIGTVGKGLVSAVMPAPISFGLNAYNAYQNYQQNPERGLGTAIANALSGAGGYVGALSNMYNGNYGAAAAGALGKSGVDMDVANLAGIGIDYNTGKDVGPAMGGFAGRTLGRAAGGTLGGMFGQSFGQHLGKQNSVRK